MGLTEPYRSTQCCEHAGRRPSVPSGAGWSAIGAAMTVALLAPDPALAHTGAGHALSFAAGFAHPLSGIDHMLAMVAVGLWAGIKGGRASWLWPFAFVATMVAGGMLGAAGMTMPMVEFGILASIVVLGLLVYFEAELPLAAGAALIAAFAFVHGHAHGAELPADAAAGSFAAGFALATAFLHGTGLAIAHACASQRNHLILRSAGGATAAAGVLLAIL